MVPAGPSTMNQPARQPRTMRIEDRAITDDAPCYVIAEIGHNHQGSVEKAQQLFAEATAAGPQR